jgi:hypothetical protein
VANFVGLEAEGDPYAIPTVVLLDRLKSGIYCCSGSAVSALDRTRQPAPAKRVVMGSASAAAAELIQENRGQWVSQAHVIGRCHSQPVLHS